MEIKICIPFLLLLLASRARSQSPRHHRSYDWRTTGALGDWPKLTSLLPYAPAPTDSSSVHYPAQPYHQPPYPEDSPPYADDSSSAYSQEYHLAPYGEVPQSLSSYESYQDPRDEELNMTMARVGGFAGSGDTKGFGAYDFPKDNRHQEFRHPDPPLHHHQRPPQRDPELEELMRISKQRSESYRDPHPLLPPL